MSTADIKLSESTLNIIENLAWRIAENHGGRITANHLIPYLPVSLDIIKSCLKTMVDGTSVISEEIDNITEFEFSSYKNNGIKTDRLTVNACVACDSDISRKNNDIICSNCFETLKKELNILAEKMGWPAQAVYEHEVLYITSKHGLCQDAGTLAGHSRYTLRRMRAKLERLSVDGYTRQKLDEVQGIVEYEFPDVKYPRGLYNKNMDIITTYPASVMEEVQYKVTKILFSLGLILFIMLVLAIFHVPFPLLILFLIIVGPVTAITIWRHKERPDE